MCVIIDKLPGKTLDFNMLLSAACRNPDGWGIVMHDGSTHEVRQGLSKPGHAAEAVARALEELKDGRALIHFRYRTQGDRNKENTHPFQILSKEDDGLGLWLMHNGTITEFSGNWKDSDFGDSDTRKFATQLVTPLARVMVHGGDPDKLLEDPLFATILKKYVSSDKLSLIDDKGRVLHINRKGGYEFDWGWASNKYSLESVSSIKAEDWTDAGKEAPQSFFREKVGAKEESTGMYKHGGFTPLSERKALNDSAANIIAYNRNTPYTIEQYEPENRADICKILDISDLTELFVLDEKQIRTIVTKHPDTAVLMIIELMYDIYTKNIEAARDRKAA